MNNQNEITSFIKTLRRYRYFLSKQEIKTLRGQAINGDLEGAKKGFCRLMEIRRCPA